MRKRSYKGKDLAYYLFKIIRYPVKWFIHSQLNLNLVRNEAKDDMGPFFITGNHVTAYDPIITLVYVKPLIKFVAADANYDNKLKTFFMNRARVIPIAKRNMDIRTIKRLLEEVKNGNAVGLYPEGGRTWHGETDDIIKSTAKLIKMLGIKVYVQKLEGAYLSSPRWGKTLRKGITNVTIYKILSEEEVEKMTDSEIYEVMKEHMYHNDYEYQRNHMIPLENRDNAEYIERLIYTCPICHSFNTFKSHKDTFLCKECNSFGNVDQYGFINGDFPYDNLVDWYKFQREYLKNFIKDNKINPIEIYDVKYKTNVDNGKIRKYLVNLFINNENIILEIDGDKKIIEYKNISEPSLTFKNTLIFFENNIRHEFIIEPFLHNNTSIMYVKDIILNLRGKIDE